MNELYIFILLILPALIVIVISKINYLKEFSVFILFLYYFIGIFIYQQEMLFLPYIYFVIVYTLPILNIIIPILIIILTKKKLKLLLYLPTFFIFHFTVLNLYYPYGGTSKASFVKGNMHTFQTMLETYAVDWGGQYPINVSALKKEAEEKKYWKDFKNPYSGSSGKNLSFADMDEKLTKKIPHLFYTEQGKGLEGVVYYDSIKNSDNTITKYYVYGTGKEGKLLDDKGVILTLSNN